MAVTRRLANRLRRPADRWPGRAPTRLAALIALVVSCAALAAACSGDDAEDTSAAAGEAATDADRAADTAVASTTIPPEVAASDDEAAAEEETEAEGEFELPEEAAEVAEGDDAAEGGAGTAAGEDTLGSGGVTVTPTAADLGRQLIFTANVHLGVDDVGAASAEATSVIEGLGGFLFGQNTTGGTEPSSELVFKVLPEDFDSALSALGDVGELRNQSVTTDDVTERVVDLESRIEVADLGVDRLRTALEGAASLEDYAEIESLLLERESELEVMRGQLRTLQDQINLATITLLLSQDRVENAIEVTISSYDGHDGGETCPGQGRYEIEAGSAATVCFDIVNIGDQTLTDIVLTDTVLEIDESTELIEVLGSLDELPPGQAALVAFEATPERDLQLRTRVTAIPTDGISPEQVGPLVNTQVGGELDTVEPDNPPGLSDGFSVGVTVLQAIWIAVTVVVGFVIPLLPLLAVLAVLWWIWRRVRKLIGPPPPPPPMVPPPPGGPRSPGASEAAASASTSAPD